MDIEDVIVTISAEKTTMVAQTEAGRTVLPKEIVWTERSKAEFLLPGNLMNFEAKGLKVKIEYR